MISKLNVWFSYFREAKRTIPKSFDCQFFLDGFDIIIELDHHVLVSRVLSFFYTNAYLFRGEHRMMIFDFLIQKHFSLFSHWDPLVRQYYHQFIIYKMSRIRRTENDKVQISRIKDKIVFDEDGFCIGCPKSELLIDNRARIMLQTSISSLEDTIRSSHAYPKKYSYALTQYRRRLAEKDKAKSPPSLSPVVDNAAAYQVKNNVNNVNK